jgi:hypothetical protein
MFNTRRTRWTFILVLIAVCAITTTTGSPAREAQAQGPVLMTAYKVAWTHDDPAFVPHYGAYFASYSCSNYQYVGPGGQPPTPDWWGTQKAALLSKTWLFGPTWPPSIHYERWIASNHKAYCIP